MPSNNYFGRVMRTLATLQHPDEGSISFDGLDLLANPEKAREMLG